MGPRIGSKEQQQEFQELKDDLGSGRCGGLAEGIGPLSAAGRLPEGAEAVPGKANEEKTWAIRSLQAWFSSLLLMNHLEIENKGGEMSLKQRMTFRSNCKPGKLRGYFNSD